MSTCTLLTVFHIFYKDEIHLSDHCTIVTAKDAEHALGKAKSVLKKNNCNKKTITVVDEKTLAEMQTFNKMLPFYIYYQNGTGERFCRILANNKKSANAEFENRFSCGYIRILTNEEFKNGIEIKKQTKRKKRNAQLPTVTFAPYPA